MQAYVRASEFSTERFTSEQLTFKLEKGTLLSYWFEGKKNTVTFEDVDNDKQEIIIKDESGNLKSISVDADTLTIPMTPAVNETETKDRGLRLLGEMLYFNKDNNPTRPCTAVAIMDRPLPYR